MKHRIEHIHFVGIGGVGTSAVVGIWAWRFPALRRRDRVAEAAAR